MTYDMRCDLCGWRPCLSRNYLRHVKALRSRAAARRAKARAWALCPLSWPAFVDGAALWDGRQLRMRAFGTSARWEQPSAAVYFVPSTHYSAEARP